MVWPMVVASISDALPADTAGRQPRFCQHYLPCHYQRSPTAGRSAIADCNNVTITNNGAMASRLTMSGSWPAFSGYRFAFEACASRGTSIKTPRSDAAACHQHTALQRATNSTVNFRTPDIASLAIEKVLNTPNQSTWGRW
ncbi:MAG: hypothetical protein R2911_28770 [Caldilineaceae bacterium]